MFCVLCFVYHHHRLSEDGDEDEGGHDAAGQMTARHHEEQKVGDVAALLTSFSPVEEYHNGRHAT